MTSSFTQNVTLDLPANNDDIDTWDVPNNGNFTIIDQAIGGSTALSVVALSGIVALTATQYRSRVVTVTGLLSNNVNYQLPANVGGFWFVRNATTGAFTLTFSSAGGGTSLALTQGATTSLTSDGTNVRRADTNAAAAGGSSGQVQFNSGGILAGSSGLTWDGTTLSATTFSGSFTGTATSVANALTINNSGAGAASGATFNGASAITISRNTIGAAASGVNADISALNITGGVVLGAPTGGAQGTGTINATALYVNGLAVSAGSGAVSSVNASGGATGMSFSGGPITTSGTLTLGGTLGTGFGGTNLTSFTSGGAMYATSSSALTTGTLPASAGGTGITALGSGIATWLGTPSSANLASAITDETGSGALVFGTSPTLTTPTIVTKVNLPDGSNATPALAFSDCGIYRAGTRTVSISVGSGSPGLSVSNTSASFNVDTAISGLLTTTTLRINTADATSAATTTHSVPVNINGVTMYALLSNVP